MCISWEVEEKGSTGAPQGGGGQGIGGCFKGPERNILINCHKMEEKIHIYCFLSYIMSLKSLCFHISILSTYITKEITKHKSLLARKRP